MNAIIASARASAPIKAALAIFLILSSHNDAFFRRPQVTPRARFHVHGFRVSPIPCRNHRPRVDRDQVVGKRISFSISSIWTAEKIASTSPSMASAGGEESPTPASASVNYALVLQNLANQAIIGSTIWTGGSGYKALAENAHLDAFAVLLGLSGVVPMLALNLSTNMAVLNLFGPKARPASALFLSLAMATATGIVEETVFRGQCERIAHYLRAF